MNRKVQINDHVFLLDISDESYPKISTSSFHMRGRLPADLSEEEFKTGQTLQQELHAGKWDWLINKENPMTLPTHNILVMPVDVVYNGSVRFGGGTIQSSLKEICPHCRDLECDFDCMDAQEWASDRDMDCQIEKNAELASNRNYNYACDAVEAMVLGHAIAGIDIESPAYLEGVETAIDAIANNI